MKTLNVQIGYCDNCGNKIRFENKTQEKKSNAYQTKHASNKNILVLCDDCFDNKYQDLPNQDIEKRTIN